jgi:hypothetical protein
MDGTPTGGVGMYLGKCTVWNVFHHERCAGLDRARDAIGERVAHASSITRGISVSLLFLHDHSDHTHRIVGREKRALRPSH